MGSSIDYKKFSFQLTWQQLKWIAIISMTIDHVGKVLLSQVFLMEHLGMNMKTSFYAVQSMTALGRIAFPIFAFGIAQGCRLTRNPKRYLIQLALFAVISEIPYNLTLHDVPIEFRYFAFHNVFFTLLLGALCCFISSFFGTKGMAWVSIIPVLFIVLLAEFLGTDYGGFGVVFILMPYLFHKNRGSCIVSLALVTVVFYVFYAQFTGFGQYLFGWMDPQGRSLVQFFDVIGALIGVALLAFYRGEKGSVYHKWMFYFFYPAHLVVLFLLSLVTPT